MNVSVTPPDLEERFTQPRGWRWHSFERAGRTIRFGCAFPEDSIPDAVVICLHGVRECSEKYFELARWCLDNNLAFYTMDWAGQGLSTRFLKNPQKRHSQGFDADLDDLDYFIREYVKHSCVHPDKGRIPMALFAHSMGANLGLRFLHKHSNVFECAGFTAPMAGIKVFQYMPQYFALALTALTRALLGKSYVPGGADWQKRKEHARLSHDQTRKKIQNLWYGASPDLQCGDVTLGWLYEAQKSCIALQNPSIHSEIQTPCLFAIPLHEDLVDNKKTLSIVDQMPDAKLIEYASSAHEIMMETDDIRDDFLNHFYNLIKEKIIDRPETLKPF